MFFSKWKTLLVYSLVVVLSLSWFRCLIYHSRASSIQVKRKIIFEILIHKSHCLDSDSHQTNISYHHHSSNTYNYIPLCNYNYYKGFLTNNLRSLLWGSFFSRVAIFFKIKIQGEAFCMESPIFLWQQNIQCRNVVESIHSNAKELECKYAFVSHCCDIHVHACTFKGLVRGHCLTN